MGKGFMKILEGGENLCFVQHMDDKVTSFEITFSCATPRGLGTMFGTRFWAFVTVDEYCGNEFVSRDYHVYDRQFVVIIDLYVMMTHNDCIDGLHVMIPRDPMNLKGILLEASVSVSTNGGGNIVHKDEGLMPKQNAETPATPWPSQAEQSSGDPYLDMALVLVKTLLCLGLHPALKGALRLVAPMSSATQRDCHAEYVLEDVGTLLKSYADAGTLEVPLDRAHGARYYYVNPNPPQLTEEQAEDVQRLLRGGSVQVAETTQQQQVSSSEPRTEHPPQHPLGITILGPPPGYNQPVPPVPSHPGKRRFR
jgi:hypothetical protein